MRTGIAVAAIAASFALAFVVAAPVLAYQHSGMIAISLDPEALENHFGDTPIYGMVITPEIMQHIMNATTASTMMGNMSDYCDRMHGNTTTAMTGEMWK